MIDLQPLYKGRRSRRKRKTRCCSDCQLEQALTDSCSSVLTAYTSACVLCLERRRSAVPMQYVAEHFMAPMVDTGKDNVFGVSRMCAQSTWPISQPLSRTVSFETLDLGLDCLQGAVCQAHPCPSVAQPNRALSSLVPNCCTTALPRPSSMLALILYPPLEIQHVWI